MALSTPNGYHKDGDSKKKGMVRAPARSNRRKIGSQWRADSIHPKKGFFLLPGDPFLDRLCHRSAPFDSVLMAIFLHKLSWPVLNITERKDASKRRLKKKVYHNLLEAFQILYQLEESQKSIFLTLLPNVV
jgi:hypothetical protein